MFGETRVGLAGLYYSTHTGRLAAYTRIEREGERENDRGRGRRHTVANACTTTQRRNPHARACSAHTRHAVSNGDARGSRGGAGMVQCRLSTVRL